ncbi:MAG: hypothetical protein HYZ52_00730 [Candidatus Omnitrophica bacterium]|nr:hypothetical protein [Candidatus Omnitrophota bacterium]
MRPAIRKDPQKNFLDPADFETPALQLFRRQFERNENYRRFCLAEGKKPGSLKNWKEIPAIPTDGFKNLVLTTFPVKKAVKLFRTSGTTGRGRGAHFFDTLKYYEAAIGPPFEKHLLFDNARLRFFFLMASPGEAADSSLSHMMGVVNRRYSRPPGKFYARRGRFFFKEMLADLKKEKGPVLILATAFSLKGFLDFLNEKKISVKLPPKSRLFETGGFKGRAREISKKSLYVECKKRLGIPENFCVSEYGMTELSSQFYSAGGRPFEGPPWTRTLVIDPATGEEAKKGEKGLLRHWDLANRGSVMAVQTEDLGLAHREGFELLGRAPEAEIRGCSTAYEEFLAS